VTFMCHQLQFVIDIADPALSQITNNMDTQGVILMGVGVPNMPATIRELVLPITVHTNMLGSATCNTSGMKCSLVPDQGMSPPDPIWHCSGT